MAPWVNDPRQTNASSQIVKLLLTTLSALALPFIIRTIVVEGVAVATEVSTIGIFYTVLADIFFYRKSDGKLVYPMPLEAEISKS